MKKKFVRIILVFIVHALFAFPMSSGAFADTRYVAPSSMGGSDANPGTEGSPWRTIVYAVSNSNSGDIIKLMDDDDNETKDYSETDWVLVNKQLTIERYDDDATKPWVYTQVPSKHVFNIAADYVTISGLMITGATGTSQAGIYVRKNDCTFHDNEISNNYYGIYLGSPEKVLFMSRLIIFQDYCLPDSNRIYFSTNSLPFPVETIKAAVER